MLRTGSAKWDVCATFLRTLCNNPRTDETYSSAMIRLASARDVPIRPLLRHPHDGTDAPEVRCAAAMFVTNHQGRLHHQGLGRVRVAHGKDTK